jgi:hypothetical protein
MTRIVTGLFDGHRAVDLVVEHLVQEFAVPRERIQVHAADAASGEEARSPQDDDQEASLFDLGLPDDLVRACGEAMRRGRILVAAWVEDRVADHAKSAYQEYGAENVEARVAEMPTASGRDPDRRIRTLAYFLWEREGRPEGRDQEFWHRARQAVEGDGGEAATRAPREFAGETGAAPLPEQQEGPRR